MGQDVVGQNFVGQDVAGAISLGQEVSGAGGSGAGRRESRRAKTGTLFTIWSSMVQKTSIKD